MPNEWVRVTDEVTPRREYSILESQVTEDHEVLEKPAAYADGTPLPPKYTPSGMAAPQPTPQITTVPAGPAKTAAKPAETPKEN